METGWVGLPDVLLWLGLSHFLRCCPKSHSVWNSVRRGKRISNWVGCRDNVSKMDNPGETGPSGKPMEGACESPVLEPLPVDAVVSPYFHPTLEAHIVEILLHPSLLLGYLFQLHILIFWTRPYFIIAGNPSSLNMVIFLPCFWRVFNKRETYLTSPFSSTWNKKTKISFSLYTKNYSIG